MNNIFLAKGARRYGVDVSDLELIGGFSDNVFECKGNSRRFILKFYPSTDYEKNSIESELDWISYLLQAGVNVTAPIPSLSGKLIEVIPSNNGEECYVTAFEKAKGHFVNASDKNEWNAKLFYTWGITLGRIHSLSKKYNPPNENIQRKE